MIIAPRQWPKTGRTPPQVCTSLTIQLAAELEQPTAFACFSTEHERLLGLGMREQTSLVVR